MIVIKFFRLNTEEKLVECRTEKCYNVFEADDIVERDKDLYDHIEVTEVI
jgi:hypothetical protein